MRRSFFVLSAAALLVLTANASSSADTAAATADARVRVAEPAAAAAAQAPAVTAVAAAASGVMDRIVGDDHASAVLAAHPLDKTSAAPPRTTKTGTPGARLVSSSRDACVMSVPVNGEASSFLAKARTVIAAKGGTVTGTTSAGSFSVPAPLGQVDGRYELSAGAAQLTIAPGSLGMVQSCSRVYAVLSSKLGD